MKTRRRRGSSVIACKASAQPVDLGMLPQLLGYELRLAQRAVFADFASTVEREISPGLFGMLVIIDANPGLKQTELSIAVGLDRSSIVPAIDRLEARKLVLRKISEIDRRSYGLFLTRAGSKLLVRMRRQVLIHEARVAKRLTGQERTILMSLLERLIRN